MYDISWMVLYLFLVSLHKPTMWYSSAYCMQKRKNMIIWLWDDLSNCSHGVYAICKEYSHTHEVKNVSQTHMISQQTWGFPARDLLTSDVSQQGGISQVPEVSPQGGISQIPEMSPQGDIPDTWGGYAWRDCIACGPMSYTFPFLRMRLFILKINFSIRNLFTFTVQNSSPISSACPFKNSLAASET